MCRQRAGCNPGTAKADGQRAWWKLPRGIWSVLRVLRVWSLANGRLECPNNRGLCAGKGQVQLWNSKSWRWWKLARGIWRVLRVLRVWRLANGRLECRNNRGLCAGKGQAATLEQQKLTARGLQMVEAAARDLEGFKGLKPGKRQAWMPEQERAMCRQRAGCNPGTAKADGQRAWWQVVRGIWRVLRV